MTADARTLSESIAQRTPSWLLFRFDIAYLAAGFKTKAYLSLFPRSSATLPQHKPLYALVGIVHGIGIVAAFCNDYWRGAFFVSPVSPHITVGKMPVSDIFYMVDRLYLTDFSFVFSVVSTIGFSSRI